MPEPSSSGLNFASIARKGKPQQKVQQQQPQTVVAVGGGSSGMIRLGGVLPRARVVVRPDSDSEPEPEGNYLDNCKSKNIFCNPRINPHVFWRILQIIRPKN